MSADVVPEHTTELGSDPKYENGPGIPAATADGLVSVFEEVLRLAGKTTDQSGLVSELVQLTSQDLEEVRRLHNPPVVVRRTLEVTFLLLNAGTATSARSPPTWYRVQKMLSDAGFLIRMRDYDGRALRSSSALASFVATEYFGAGSDGTEQPTDGTTGSARRRLSTESPNIRASRRRASWAPGDSVNEEPLTFQRVQHASRAAAKLVAWCTSTLVETFELMPETISSTPEDEPEPVPQTEVAKPEPVEEPQPVPVTEPVKQEPDPPKPVVRPVVQPVLPPAPKPKPKPAPTRPPEATLPDRHFEVFIGFDEGFGSFSDEGLPALQTVAATLSMRKKNLRLELQGCASKAETAALLKVRLQACDDFFEQNGLESHRSAEPSRLAPPDGSPGIICNIVLTGDKELKDWFIMREQGEEFTISKHLRCVVEMLESEWQTCRH